MSTQSAFGIQVELGPCHVVQDEKGKFTIYTLYFRIAEETHVFTSRYAKLYAFHQQLSNNEEFQKSFSYNPPDFPPKSWFTDFTKPKNYRKRANKILKYFKILTSRPSILSNKQFQKGINLPHNLQKLISQIVNKFQLTRFLVNNYNKELSHSSHSHSNSSTPTTNEQIEIEKQDIMSNKQQEQQQMDIINEISGRMSDLKRCILVNGYIRELQLLLLSQNTIIPIDIVTLCYLFSSNSFKIFVNIQKTNEVQILDIESKAVSHLNDRSIDTIDHETSDFQPLCYMDNITSHCLFIYESMINKEKMYDGILYLEKDANDLKCFYDDKPAYYPSVKMFESNLINTKSVDYITIKSKLRFPRHHQKLKQFLYCGVEHGVIYERNGILYQLKLQDIDSDFIFKQIQSADDTFWDFETNIFVQKYLTMQYLPKTQRIFAIYNQWDDSVFTLRLLHNVTDTNIITKSAKCGIFDMVTLRWQSIADLKYKRTDNERDKFYQYSICYNPYNEDIIYAVSNTGHIEKYDVDLNEWETLIEDGLSLKYKTDHFVWMDSKHILCCTDGTYFGSLDVRDSKPKWMKMNDWINIAQQMGYDEQSIFLF